MVWVDTPLNQAKSSVVSDSSGSANAPPQTGSIKSITNFLALASQEKLMNYEYYIRNFAALGGCDCFLSCNYHHALVIHEDLHQTEMRMQTRLAEVTPDIPAVNLPVEFNNWLRSLLNSYNARYTSRLTNMWNFYSAKMNAISATQGPVPQCFTLYHAGRQAQAAGQVAISPQTFNIANMIPAAPNLPTCNAPGTLGHVQYGLLPNGATFKSFNNHRILGAGSMDYYGLGTGTDFSRDVFAAKRFNSIYAHCQNSWDIGPSPSKAGLTDVFLDMACNGGTGNKVTTPMTFVVNNQPLACVIILSGGQAFTVCDSTHAAATTCANSVMQVSFPTGLLLTGDMYFVPN
ncbi:hypothetical protein FB45DRAFT_1066365 [Roridomyces roridus]|uniref:Uncharacterized protein n=1 Tax=Roridomyces roridus TaxID=1738132 RepID=A0AAD7F9C1_9AGAR|nr:hypothetical protein FB45DRAFT_1066365 [Roridomyces roridus]